MTLRAARKGVQSMKSGGLTAGAHDPRYRTASLSSNRPGYSSTSTNVYPRTGTGASLSQLPNNRFGAAGSTYSTSTRGTYSTLGTPQTTVGTAASFSSTSTSLASSLSQAVADIVDQHGTAVRVMDSKGFRDFGGINAFHGQVETLQAYEGAGVVEKVLQSPGTGKVLVVDGGGNMHSAIFGKTAATTAKQNGWKGVIIHGVIRDAKVVKQTQIGCKAMGSNPTRGRATTGSKGSAINIAGMQFTPGMWVYVDEDGIVVSDRELSTSSATVSMGSTVGSVGTTSVVGGTTMSGTGTPATMGTVGTGATTFSSGTSYNSGMTSAQTNQLSGSSTYERAQPSSSAGYGRTLPQGGSSYPYSHGASKAWYSRATVTHSTSTIPFVVTCCVFVLCTFLTI